MSKLDFFLAELDLYDPYLLADFTTQTKKEEYVIFKHKTNTITLKLIIRRDGTVTSLLKNYVSDRVLSNTKLCPSALIKYLKQDSIISFVNT